MSGALAPRPFFPFWVAVKCPVRPAEATLEDPERSFRGGAGPGGPESSWRARSWRSGVAEPAVRARWRRQKGKGQLCDCAGRGRLDVRRVSARWSSFGEDSCAGGRVRLRRARPSAGVRSVGDAGGGPVMGECRRHRGAHSVDGDLARGDVVVGPVRRVLHRSGSSSPGRRPWRGPVWRRRRCGVSRSYQPGYGPPQGQGTVHDRRHWQVSDPGTNIRGGQPDPALRPGDLRGV